MLKTKEELLARRIVLWQEAYELEEELRFCEDEIYKINELLEELDDDVE